MLFGFRLWQRMASQTCEPNMCWVVQCLVWSFFEHECHCDSSVKCLNPPPVMLCVIVYLSPVCLGRPLESLPKPRPRMQPSPQRRAVSVYDDSLLREHAALLDYEGELSSRERALPAGHHRLLQRIRAI